MSSLNTLYGFAFYAFDLLNFSCISQLHITYDPNLYMDPLMSERSPWETKVFQNFLPEIMKFLFKTEPK